MSACFQTVFTIVCAIEGFSIWKGKKLLDLPNTSSIERYPCLTDKWRAKLIEALKEKRTTTFVTACYTLIACVCDFALSIIVPVFNAFLWLLRWCIVVIWYCSDWFIKYSVIFTIPTLSYLYLGQVTSCCRGEEFYQSDWVLIFVLVKVGCYLSVFIISGLEYILTSIKPRINKSIIEVSP